MDRENSVYLEHAYGVSIWFDRSRSSEPFTLDIPHRRGITLRDTNFTTLGKARGAAAKLTDEPEATPIGLHVAYRAQHDGPWRRALLLRSGGHGYVIRPIPPNPADEEVGELYVSRYKVALADNQDEVDELNRLDAEHARIEKRREVLGKELPRAREKLIAMARAQRRRPSRFGAPWGATFIQYAIDRLRESGTLVLDAEAGAPFDVVVAWVHHQAEARAHAGIVGGFRPHTAKLLDALRAWHTSASAPLGRKVQS